MALTKISASVIAANAIVAAGVAENSISTSEIATDGVGTLQISNGAVTSGKLETNVDIAGTLDVTGVLTADSNVVIAGNLTVNGTTVTNSSTNTTIADALIELGTGTTGSPANDAGIVIERGDSDNAFIGWDESADTFILGTGSFTGASTGNLTISTAPLSVGTLTASGITFPTSDGSSGQVLKTDGSGTLTFDAQTAVVDNFTATGDGSTTDFDTGINPGDEVNTWVFIDGVYQQKGEYSYSGSTISFSTAPDSGATIDVTTGTVGGFASADSVLGVYETTTTNTDTYTTGISASNENNTWVFVGGVYQPKDSYTFSSGTLTFDANTPTGQKLSVTATKSLSAGSVETNSITANAVTSAKIASNSILSRHIANNSIVGADISATTQITASTFTGALTGDVTGNVTGNLTGTVLTAAQANITSLGTLSALTVSGQLTAGGIAYPTLDGSADQVLKTDGSGTLSFGTISGTTLNNNTNNYVMTGTGSANTLNGESGLTYDGSTLAVTGAITSDSSVTALTNFNSTTGNDLRLNAGSANRDIFMQVNGSTLMTVQGSTGNVGIGTSTLNKVFNIADPNQGGETLKLHFEAESSADKWAIYSYDRTNGHYADMSFGANYLYLKSGGNVGIGTTSPTTPLHVQSSTVNQNTVLVKNTAGTGVNYGLEIAAGTNATDHALQVANAAGTSMLRVTGGGNVGIGTASPANKLHVKKSSTAVGEAILTLEGGVSGYGTGISFQSVLTGGSLAEMAKIVADGEAPWSTTTSTQDALLRFYTTGNGASEERMRISSGGRVGIGTTSPGSVLHIEGDTNGYGTAPILYFGSISTANAAVRDWAIGPADSNYGDFHIYQGASTGASPLATSNAKFTINVSGNVGIGTTSPSSKLTVNGSLSKSSGSFRIDHPLEAKSTTHDLVHSFVEAPQADNIYRGKVDLVSGSATVNIDTIAGMTEGTFVALNREVQCFTTNESNWDAVKGSVSGNSLTIESQNSESTATISWLVIGERQDSHMYDTEWTDEDGKVIVEPSKTN